MEIRTRGQFVRAWVEGSIGAELIPYYESTVCATVNNGRLVLRLDATCRRRMARYQASFA
jgi:hypothetical protein